MKRNKLAVLYTTAIALLIFVLAGCSQQEEQSKPDPDFSNATYIADLATLECYSHNVAKLEDEGSWFLNMGYRKLWYEYSGVVKIGVDAKRVIISQPDANNVVTITVPEAQIIGKPDVDESSIVETVSDKALWFDPDYSIEDKQEALVEAQEEMLASISNNDTLMAQARQRAKDLLEEYVRNVGDVLGETYTVKWVDAAQS